jgi:hypothetical protein
MVLTLNVLTLNVLTLNVLTLNVLTNYIFILENFALKCNNTKRVMAEYNLTVQMEKYDAAAVEADLRNLDEEIADEDAVNTTLVSTDSATRTAAVRAFLTDNKDRITDQHGRMQARTKTLRDMIVSNQVLEAADAEYKALVESEDAQLVARLLTELNALSLQYHDLLLNSGRAGRPPLF